MERQVTFTSTLPQKVLRELERQSAIQKLKKNKIIERALQKYFEEHRRSEFIESFKRAKDDSEMITMAEEGVADYLKLLDE